MTAKRVLVLTLTIVLVFAAFAPAMAQDMEVIADGLRNPRNLTFDADGNLYIAEAGISGGQLTINEDPFGASGQVTMMTPDGDMEIMVRGLISYREGNPLGATDIAVTDASVWVLLAETSDFSIPFSHALVELDRENGRIQTWVDLLAPELELDPDGNPNQQSNPNDLEVLDDGTVLIANAGCNCLMTWSPDAGVEIAAVWNFEDDNPVPTSIDVDANGDIYVGFLTGFPFPEGGSRVERWSGGELVETFEGLTAVTGLLVADDGTVYASEFGVFNGEGWDPGRIVTVSADGITPVMEGVMFPYGLAQSPDGTIVAAVNTLGPDNGQIIVVPTE